MRLPLSIIGDFYVDKPSSAQDCVNWIPYRSEIPGPRSEWKLRTCPGTKPWWDVADRPIRVGGIHDCEGRLFVVAGRDLLRIRDTTDPQWIGRIPGVGPVSMAHNQTQLKVVNGSAGYIYDLRADGDGFQRITDEGYPGEICTEFVDQYFVGIEPSRRYALNSDLADGMEYNTLDRWQSEASPDLMTGLKVSNLEVVIFSESSIEIFGNTGELSQPFRSKRIAAEIGCPSGQSIAKMDNTLFFLASDGTVRRMEGYNPVRVSTHPIERLIRGYNWKQAIGYAFVDLGHSIYYLTFPDGVTIGYDVATGRWHRRVSYGLRRWRVNALAKWNNQWIAGDFQKGRLYKVDWGYHLEGDHAGALMVGEYTSGVIHADQAPLMIPCLEVVVETGSPPTKPVPFRYWRPT